MNRTQRYEDLIWGNVNKYLLYAFLLFLPFNYALTVSVGFPLKLSEVAIGAIILLLFIDRRSHWKFFLPNKFFLFFLLFLFQSILSFGYNLSYDFGYSLTEQNYRFGPNMNSLFKVFYVAVIYFATLIAYHASKNNRSLMINLILTGAVAASLYGWYLFFLSLYDLPALQLPGMDDWPQHGLYSFGHFVRSGTFKEGNYTGLFLLTSAILAIYVKKWYIGTYLTISILPTVSAMAMIGLLLFGIFYILLKFTTKGNLIKAALLIFSLIGILIITAKQQDISFVLSKFNFFGSGHHVDANRSKIERLNQMSIAYQIGQNNLLTGVGLSNYSRHFERYNDDPTYYDKDFKYIPNNVYLEIFSELGIPGLLVFIIMLFYVFRSTWRAGTPILQCAIGVYIFYLMAFPTFSVLFIWVFFGILLSLQKKENDASDHQWSILNAKDFRSTTICF